MVNGPDISYQPSVAYQGGAVANQQQEPKTGQTQPKEAPAADTQRGDQRAAQQSAPSGDRGRNLDVSA